MIIDLILDRKDSLEYSPKDFYRGCMSYGRSGEDITRAMDFGTEDDVKKMLCKYIRDNEYNPLLADYIERINWLSATDPGVEKSAANEFNDACEARYRAAEKMKAPEGKVSYFAYECGVLVDKRDEEFGAYSINNPNLSHGFCDEDQDLFSQHALGNQIHALKNYVKSGVEKTYAIISFQGFTDIGGEFSKALEAGEADIVDSISYSYFKDPAEIVWSACKVDGQVVEGFLEKEVRESEMHLTGSRTDSASFARKNPEMSNLSDLLERAFENKGNKNRYTDGPWSVAFDERTWDTRFELYYNNVPVMEGNTLDKELKLTNGNEYPVERLIPEVEKALPEYHFDIRVAIMIPVDFNDYWTREIENAEYAGVIDECRFEDVSEGYGYDVVAFTVPHLSDVKGIVMIDEYNEKFSVEAWDMRVADGKVEISPTIYSPIQEIQGPSQKTAMSLNDRIREAEKKGEERREDPGTTAPEKGKDSISRD